MGTGWGADEVVAAHATAGFSDPGEAAAIEAVADLRRGRVLDIAVGGGRTTGLLIDDAATYLGVDIAPEMIALAQARFPDADLRVADARSLDGVAEASYDLVLFSLNGLDSLDHPGRAAALRSMARVVAPTGRVVFSSLNLDGVSYEERPWTLHGFRSGRAFLHLALNVRHPVAWVRSVRSYRRSRRLSQDGPGWAMRPMRALGFRFVVHFATLASTVGMAEAAGLETVSAFGDAGAPVDVRLARTDADYVHYVCRRAGSAPRST